MSLSIVIVNWNAKELLRKCLTSLRDTCADLQPQVIVVDGGSFDGCAEMIALSFPEVEFIQSPSNVGFGRANNLGVERATGKALLLLNPDTEARTGSIQRLLAELHRMPRPGVLGARLENPDGSIQPTSVHVLPTPIVEAFRSDFLGRFFQRSRFGGHAIRLTATATCPVEAISGACMMMHTEVFRRAGGFTEDYFMYAEDMDLCFKVRQLGLENYFVPASRVAHEGGGCSATQPSTFATLGMRHAILQYMLINHGRGAALVHRVAMMLATTLKLLLVGVALFFTRYGSAKLRRTFEEAILILRWSVGLQKPPKQDAASPVIPVSGSSSEAREICHDRTSAGAVPAQPGLS